MKISRYNRLCNPFYPFFSFNPAFLEGDLQALAEQEDEILLFAAHVAVKKSDCLLLVSNQRLVLYRLRVNSLMRRAARFAIKEGTHQLLGTIPGYFAVADVAGAVGKGAREGLTGKNEAQAASAAERKFLTKNVDRSAEKQLANKRGFGRSIGKQLFSVPLEELLPDIEAVTIREGQANIVVRSGSAHSALNDTTPIFHHDYAGAIFESILSRQADYLAGHDFFLAPQATDLGIYRSRTEEVERASETLDALRTVDFFTLEEVDPGFARRPTDAWDVRNASGETLGTPELHGLIELEAYKGQYLIIDQQVPFATDCNVQIDGLCRGLLAQEWCGEIKAVFLVPGGDDILAQWLLEIASSDEATARYVWGFSGAVPFTCINAMRIPNRVESRVFAFDLFESWLAAPELLENPPFLTDPKDYVKLDIRPELKEEIALMRRVKIAQAVSMAEAAAE
jgi:hypothetical protein